MNAAPALIEVFEPDEAQVECMKCLWKAAQRGDVVEMRRLLSMLPYSVDAMTRDSYVDLRDAPHEQHKFTWSLLQIAAHNDHVRAVEALLEAKADFNNAWGAYNRTALIAAVRMGSVGATRALLRAKACPHMSSNGIPLVVAARGGHDNLVQLLLGAKVSADLYKRPSPLEFAAEHNDINICRRLLQAKADPNARNSNSGDTPLHFATYCGHFAITQMLVDAKAHVDIRVRGTTPMQYAQLQDHDDVVQLLLEAKAAIDE